MADPGKGDLRDLPYPRYLHWPSHPPDFVMRLVRHAAECDEALAAGWSLAPTILGPGEVAPPMEAPSPVPDPPPPVAPPAAPVPIEATPEPPPRRRGWPKGKPRRAPS